MATLVGEGAPAKLRAAEGENERGGRQAGQPSGSGFVRGNRAHAPLGSAVLIVASRGSEYLLEVTPTGAVTLGFN